MQQKKNPNLTDGVKLELEGLRNEIKSLKKEIEKLEKENKDLLIAKAPGKRGDHEVIYNGEHFTLNFNELLKLMDAIARGSRYMNLYQGPRGAQLALAKILSFHSAEDSGMEKAQEMILRFSS